uniref:RING-type domain-containing protein n=1 Tax=Setaria italica TaxID=4555 RepID=K3Y1U6_SETIT
MSSCSNITAAPAPEAPSPSPSLSSPLDYDVVVILAAMLCALGLNSMLQCVARCARRAVSDPVGWAARRRASAGLKREDVVALPVATYDRVLPVCGHRRFHVACIDRWFVSHCSCRTCRRRLSSESVAGGHHHLQVLTAMDDRSI